MTFVSVALFCGVGGGWLAAQETPPETAEGPKAGQYRLLHKRSKLLLEGGQISGAVEAAKRALEVAKQTFGLQDARVTTALLRLARAYLAQTKYELAETFATQALMIAESYKGPDDRSQLRALRMLARIYDKQGDRTRAGKMVERADSQGTMESKTKNLRWHYFKQHLAQLAEEDRE